MSKKSYLMNLLTMMLLTMLSVGFVSCGGDDDENINPNNGQPVNPNTKVDDPEGTIMLSMRNTNNGKTYLDNSIYIKNENFAGASFVSLGAMKGLGNVSTIPTTGWANQVSVIVGSGYVAYANGQFYRIYVVDNIVSTSGGIIGADIKYQKPFKGVDEAISIEDRNLTFENEGGSQTLVFKNKNVVVFEASSDQPWCHVRKTSTYDNYFLYNAVIISVDPSSVPTEETANVCLKTVYGQELVINVTRAGIEPKGTGSQENPYNISGVLKYISSLGADVESPEAVYVKGKVKSITEQFGIQYGNATFTIVDDGFNFAFTAYRILYLENKRYTVGDLLKENDDVIVCGKVVNFKGTTPETVQGSAYLYSLNGETDNGETDDDGGTPQGTGSQADPFNVAAAVKKCQEAGETATTEIFFVKGIVKEEYTVDSYKNATFDMFDSEGASQKFTAYRVKGADGKGLKEGYKVPKGATVIVSGKLINYKGNSPETAQNSGMLISVNGNAPDLDNGEDGGGETL